MSRRLVVEADGGSRGNPGPAAYGALVRDADSGGVLIEVAEAFGEATNNVAEYRGLIAGLQAAARIDPDAELEVRLDSKLVVEQMGGGWRIKNAALRDLALQARRLAPGARYTWIPRAENAAADALVNEVLDAGGRHRVERVTGIPGVADAQDVVGDAAEESQAARGPGGFAAPWGHGQSAATLTLLGRHGATEFSIAKRFSGRGGADVGLADLGRAQAGALAEEVVARGGVDVVVASPLLRTRQTAEPIARACGVEIEVDDGLAECGFGDWDGHTFAEVAERWPDELSAWLGSVDVAPPGGESFAECRERVDAARRRILTRHAGHRIAIVSHVSPIKMMTGASIDAPLSSLFSMELSPGSLTTIAWYPDGHASLFAFAESGHLRGLLGAPGA